MSEDYQSNADIIRMSQNMKQYGIGLVLEARTPPTPTPANYTAPSTIKTLEQVAEELRQEREPKHYIAPIVKVLLRENNQSTTPSAPPSIGSRVMGSVMGILSYATPSYFRRQ